MKSLYELGIDIYRAHLESRWDSIESKIILGLLTSIEAGTSLLLTHSLMHACVLTYLRTY